MTSSSRFCTTSRAYSLLITLAIAAGLLMVGPAAPAHACSCNAGPNDAYYVERADLAFVGRVTATKTIDDGYYVRRHTIAVDKIYKGPRVSQVAWFGLTEGCEAPLPTGQQLTLLAVRDGEGRWTGACGGRDIVSEADLIAMQPVLGPPKTIYRDTPDVVDDHAIAPVAIGAGVVTLLVVSGLVWIWRRRRTARARSFVVHRRDVQLTFLHYEPCVLTAHHAGHRSGAVDGRPGRPGPRLLLRSGSRPRADRAR